MLNPLKGGSRDIICHARILIEYTSEVSLYGFPKATSGATGER